LDLRGLLLRGGEARGREGTGRYERGGRGRECCGVQENLKIDPEINTHNEALSDRRTTVNTVVPHVQNELYVWRKVPEL